MRMGIIKIADELLIHGHEFPESWEIIDIWKPSGKRYVEALISGPEFPEVKGNDSYANCNVIVHTERIAFDDEHPAPEFRTIYKHGIRKI